MFSPYGGRKKGRDLRGASAKLGGLFHRASSAGSEKKVFSNEKEKNLGISSILFKPLLKGDSGFLRKRSRQNEKKGLLFW